MIQQTVRTAQTQREAVLAAARVEAEQILRDGAESNAAEHGQVVIDMRAKLDGMALDVLRKATGSVQTAEQERLVDEYIARETAPAGHT